MGKCNPQKYTKKVSPVECLLCLPVLQICCDCIYLHYKFLVIASICTLYVYLHLLVQVHLVAVVAIVAVIMTGQVVVAATSKTMLCQTILSL